MTKYSPQGKCRIFYLAIFQWKMNLNEPSYMFFSMEAMKL